ncbi:MAG: hypothetical protein ACRC1J_05125 [Sandaracinobacteroides sp.]
MSLRSRCLTDDKPWLLRYAIAFAAILGFGAFALGLGDGVVPFRLQAAFFVLLFSVILLPLFEMWWRDCPLLPHR